MSASSDFGVSVSLCGAPVPQSSCRSYERMKGLEAAILLRRREIDELRQRRDTLQSAAVAQSQVVPGGALIPAKSKRIQMRDAEPLEVFDPTQIAIVRMVAANNGSFDVFNIPPERFGDTCLELDVAKDNILQHAAALVKETEALSLEVCEYEKDTVRLREQIQLVCDLTGIPLASASLAGAGHLTSNHIRREVNDVNNSMAPGYKVARRLVDSSGAVSSLSSPSEMKAKNDELRKILYTLTKEIRDAKVLVAKKEKAILDLQSQVDKKVQLKEETFSLYNSIRVKDREVRERKRDLRAVLEDHDRLDEIIGKASLMKASSSVGVMDRDLTMIRQKITECLEDERRIQDRVSKAQEYRISVLNRRIAMILDSVKNHKLDKDVDALIASTLELQRQQDLSSAELARSLKTGNDSYLWKNSTGKCTVGSSSTVTGSYARTTASGSTYGKQRSGVTTPSARADANSRTTIHAGSLIIAPAYHKQAANEIAVLAREDLYNIDSIIPPNETIHPAIYSLFVSEKETLARRAVTTKLISEEKNAAVIAVEARNQKIERARISLDGRLHRTEKNIRVVESQKKLDLLEEVTTNRSVLQQALFENSQLSRMVAELTPLAEAAHKDHRRRALRRATANGGYGTQIQGTAADGSEACSATNTPHTQSLVPCL